MKTLLLSILLLLSLCATAQIWPKRIGLDVRASARSIREYYDQGYLISGRAFLDHYGYLHKLDVNGNSLWEKFLGKNTYYTLLNNVDISPDNSLYISGSSGKLDELGDPIVIKMNPCAEIEWCRLLHKPDNMDYAHYIKATSDGGAIALTAFYSSDPQQERIFLIKFDAQGHRQWQQLYGQSDPLFNSEFVERIDYLDEDKYILTGIAYYPNPEGGGLVWIRPFLLAVSTDGDLLWEKALGTNSYLYGRGFTSISDTTESIYAFGTHYGEQIDDDEAPGLFKTDHQGNLLWDKKLVENSIFGRASAVRWHNPYQMVVSGFHRNQANELVRHISIVDTIGQMIDSVNIEPLDYDPGNIEITYDNKYLLAGTKLIGNGTKEIVAMKLNRQLEYDTLNPGTFIYDSLCPHPITTSYIEPDCEVIVSLNEPWENPKKGEIKIHPNPAKDLITIKLPEYLYSQHTLDIHTVSTARYDWRRGARLTISDMQGQILAALAIPKTKVELQVDISSWPRGMYLIRILAKNNLMITSKFVKQ